MATINIEALAKEYIAREQHPLFRGEVEDLLKQGAVEELNDRFYTDLAFGTGGLRGLIGGGYNRMNPYVVQRVTQGVADYIRSTVGDATASAVIAYDSRRYSDLFALEAARVFCGNGIKTFLFTSLRSTPELSFAVRMLKATTGIVVTASHNPPEYNGYKVYWTDGGQVTDPHDTGMVEAARRVGAPKVMDQDVALSAGMLVMIDTQVDDAFIDMVKRQSIRPQLLRTQGKRLKVVYTPLHGTGARPVSRALAEMGIDVTFVTEQQAPDGNFPTVAFPNPEEAAVLKMAIDLATKIKADLVLATDPDADRLGIAIPDPKGGYALITGNQLGCLLADYIFSSRRETGTLPAHPAFVKTIVTTELQSRIAEAYGATIFDVLTGFKYIAEKIKEFETGPENLSYVFGGEESYGYLVNTEVRDKDAVSAATMTAELTLYHLVNGRTLMDQLESIYRTHGFFQEKLISKTFKGQAGFETMNAIMDGLRANPPERFGDERVLTVKDYRDGTTLECATASRVKDITLPSSNVLQFHLSEGSRVTMRPSGTEPKIKLYASCCGKPGTDLATARSTVASRVESLAAALAAVLEKE